MEVGITILWGFLRFLYIPVASEPEVEPWVRRIVSQEEQMDFNTGRYKMCDAPVMKKGREEQQIDIW
jgi:hypothetical protein